MTVGISNRLTPVSRISVLMVIITAVFVSNLDLFVVNVALPQIGKDYGGASLESLSWVLNAYAIVFGALLVVAGRIADRRGHRPGFLIGLAIFTFGSLLCALVSDVGWLIGARVIQAIGAAILMPTSLALLLATTAPEKRAMVVRGWTAIGGVAAALGPVLGGLLVQANWRWIFLINIPVGIAALAVGLKVLPSLHQRDESPTPDILGAGLLILGIGSISLSLVRANAWGWGSAPQLGTLLAGLALLGWCIARSARHPSPVVELQLLRVKGFAAATAASMLFSVAFAVLILSSMLWAQEVWGYSALRAGLALAPGPLMVPLLAVAAGPVAKRIGSGPVAAAGNIFIGAGMLWWATTVGVEPNYASELLPGMILTGIGVGLALPTLVAAAATTLPAHRFATGSGIVSMARQIGAVLGVAVLISIVGTPETPEIALKHFQWGWLAAVAISVAAALAGATLPRPPVPVPVTP